jgi:hypothetical protein
MVPLVDTVFHLEDGKLTETPESLEQPYTAAGRGE